MMFTTLDVMSELASVEGMIESVVRCIAPLLKHEGLEAEYEFAVDSSSSILGHAVSLINKIDEIEKSQITKLTDSDADSAPHSDPLSAPHSDTDSGRYKIR